MATAQQGIMALPEMSQQSPSGGISPEQIAAFDQMRQSISPKEFSDELLSSASQADPQAVAEFKQALDEMDVPDEVLDLINQMVDEVLANPQNYDAIKQKYLAQGVTEDVLPEQFDPEFFAALNMAVDQLRGEPAGPQSFAKGGIAELSPIAKALASYGRNGDTMLAHITPAEARMLKKRGGAGTVNPVTGLPEFSNFFSKIGNAVKKFARSTVGRIVTTVALGFFLGPAAASALGIGASTAAGAAVAGFVGSAGSTLLAGGNLRDALKSGARTALIAGTGAAIFGDVPLTGPAEATPMEAFQTQIGKAANFLDGTPPKVYLEKAGEPVLPGQATLPGQDILPGTEAPVTTATPAPTTTAAPTAPTTAPAPTTAAPSTVPQSQVATVDLVGAPVAPPTGVPTLGEGFAKVMSGDITGGLKDIYMPGSMTPEQLMETSTFKNAITKGFSPKDALDLARKELAPSMFRTYGPTVATGLGIMGLTGGFKQKEVTSPYAGLFTGGPGSARDLIAKNPYKYYIQNLPGVRYVNGVPVGSYAQGGAVQHFEEGGMPTAQDIAAQAETQTPTLATTSNTPAVIAPPAVSSIGTAPGPVQVATPATGGYNLYSPAAQNMYYGALNQQLLSPSTTPAQGIAALQFPTNERLAEVEDLYRTMLGRDPDVGGLRFYANPQTNFSRQVIAEDIARSPEYAQRQAARAPGTPTPVDPNSPSPQLLQRTNQIRALYQQYLGRTPDESGLQFYMNPQFNMDQIQRDISNSREAQVRSLYVNLLGREPDAGGLQFYMNPQFTIDQISRDIQQSPEYLQRIGTPPPNQTIPAPPDRREAQGVAPAPAPAPAPVAPPATGPYAAEINQGRQAIPYASGTAATREDIQRIYEDVLGRTADPGGLEFYFASQFSPAQIRENMMQSPEYLARQGGGGGGGGGGRRDLDTVVPFNMGGIASLNKGGYPRRTGQIDGPGTGTSDSIPAMLSDGEFVMTAKAVRGAGGGDRRKGAKRMYALMHQLERNAARG